MIERDFHGFIGAESVRASGYHSNFVVESFHGAGGNLPFGPEPVQQEGLVGAQHPGHFLHRVQTAAHRSAAPGMKKSPSPGPSEACWPTERSAFAGRAPAPGGPGAAGASACA